MTDAFGNEPSTTRVIYADPQAKDTVYILNTGLYRSTDAGKSIRSIRVPHGDNHDLWIAPNDARAA